VRADFTDIECLGAPAVVALACRSASAIRSIASSCAP